MPIPESIPELLADLRLEMQRSLSPWCDRAGAAAYCSCSMSSIDTAGNTGEIKRYFRQGTPIFKKADLDKWIESGPVSKRRLRRMGVPC